MNRRSLLPELLALGISAAVLVSQYPDLRLTLQRAMVQVLGRVARATGTAALKLEANYQLKVSP